MTSHLANSLRTRILGGTAVVVASLLSTAGFAGLASAARPTRPYLTIANVSVVEGDSGATAATFTIAVSPAPTRKNTSVSYVTADGTAASGRDYTGKHTPVVVPIPIGAQQVTFTVPVLGDVADEADETFFVNLVNPVKAKIARSQAVVTITDDDDVPSVSIGNATASEGDGDATSASFPVTLSSPSARAVTVSYATEDGTAVDGADFTASSGTLTIEAGQTTAALVVPVVPDLMPESDETFGVRLVAADNAVVGWAAAIGTIRDNDPATTPFLSIADVAVVEGDAGSVAAQAAVSLSQPAATDVVVEFWTSPGSAAAADFTAASGSLTIPFGSTSGVISVPVAGDRVHESAESFYVTISSLTADVTTSDPQSIVTIENDDAVPSVSVAGGTVVEGDSGQTVLSFPVTLSAASEVPASVGVSTVAGTASSGVDFVGLASTLSFRPGVIEQVVQVLVVGDTATEASETLSVELSDAVGAVVAGGSALGTIVDDDQPTISVDDIRVREPQSGTSDAVFEVTLSAPAGTVVTVDYSAGGVTGTVVFAPGETAKTVVVPVSADSVVEADETFSIVLSNATGDAELLGAEATGTIVDAAAPEVSVGDAVVAPGGTASVPVTLSNAFDHAVTVTYTILDGATVVGTGTLTFPAGTTSQVVEVPAGALAEGSTLSVVLSEPANAMVGQSTGTVTVAAPTGSGSEGSGAEGSGSGGGSGSGTTGGDTATAGTDTATAGTDTTTGGTGTTTGGTGGTDTTTGGTDTTTGGTDTTTGGTDTTTGGTDTTTGGTSGTGTEATSGTDSAGTGTSVLGGSSSRVLGGVDGYWMVARDGGIFAFGKARFYGGTGGIKLNQPIAGMANTPTGKGYWLVARDGGIFSFGDAGFYGSMGGTRLAQPVVSMATTPTGKGYWLVARDGGIFSFGDATFYGSTAGRSTHPIVSMTRTPTGRGYWLLAADGEVFAFGDAGFFGSMGGRALNKAIVAMTPTSTGRGYWLVSSDGGIFSFGDATFLGSMGGTPLNKPILGITVTPSGNGYWMVASDGGIFSFGDARFFGSMGGVRLNQPMFGMAPHLI